MAAAHRLARYGHAVTILEARPKAGGLNEYGIAAYKSTDDFAQAEVDYVTAIGGIDIEYGRALGDNVHLADLTADYDAVFLGMGLGGVNALRAEGEDAEGVEAAVEFIEELRQADDLSALQVGRRVVVIGGGMTAIDAAVQSKLLGADEVTICYRRGKEHMNASEFEQDLAASKGVTIRHWMQPKRVIVEGGKVAGHRTRIYSAAGRQAGRARPDRDACRRPGVQGDRPDLCRRRAERQRARRSTWRLAGSRWTTKAAPRSPRCGPAATASSAATT